MLLPKSGYKFTISLGALMGEVRVTGFRIEEGLSAVPRCEVELISDQPDLAAVLNEAGVDQHRFTLVQKRPAREFTVQYRESDYDFFARLCAEEGLVFYHVFEDGQAILEINDSLAQDSG